VGRVPVDEVEDRVVIGEQAADLAGDDLDLSISDDV
jgi:hypothetical protein